MATRDQKDDKTNPSSHTNYSCLTSAEKDVRMTHLHKETRRLSSRIAQLEQQLAAAVLQNGITLSSMMT